MNERTLTPKERSILDDMARLRSQRKGMQPAPKSSSILELVPNIADVRQRLAQVQAVHKQLAENLSALGEAMKQQAVRMEALATWLKAGKSE